MATKIPTWVGVLILVAIAAGILLIPNGSSVRKPSEQPSGSCSSSKCVVRAPTGGESVVLAVNKESLNEMVSSGSDRAIAVMVLNGSAFLVPQNTPVSVVDRGFGVRKVLVLGGPTIGRTGWTVAEWVVDQR